MRTWRIINAIRNKAQQLLLKYASALLIVTLILFCFAGYVTYQSRDTLAKIDNAEKMIAAAEFSQRLFKAMGHWAYERGITHSALNSTHKITQDVQDKITKAISDSDIHFRWLFQDLMQSDHINADGKNIIADIKDDKKIISSLRFKVSEQIVKINHLKPTTKINDALFEKYIEIIEKAEKLQENISSSMSNEKNNKEQDGFHSSNETHAPNILLSSNMAVLQKIWMVREFTGRERAIIGAYLAKNKPFKIDELKRLSEYRGKVEASWEKVKAYMGNNVDRIGATPVHSTFIKINNEFLTRFNVIRDEIYKKNRDKEKQEKSSYEWFEASSKGIDSFQDFAEYVSEDSKSIIQSLKQKNIDELQKYKIKIGLILIITAFMFFLLLQKVIIIIRLATLFNKGHKIAGLLFNSSVSAAEERGKTYISLTATNIIEHDILHNEIYRSRQKTSSNISEAIALLSDQQISFGGKQRLINDIESAYVEVQKYRFDISPYLISNQIPIKKTVTTGWFTNCTIFIEHISTLHLAILNHVSIWSNKDNDDEISKLETLRHYLFEMSEFAGRERAIIGGALALGKLADKDSMELDEYCKEHRVELESYRKAINTAWYISRSILCRHCKSKNCKSDGHRKFNECHSKGYNLKISNEIRAAAENMVKTFLVEFTDTREGIFVQIGTNYNQNCNTSKATTTGSVNLSSGEWFDQATKAIKSIINLANEVGRNIDIKTKKAEQKGKHLLHLLLLTGGIGIGIAIWSFCSLS